MATKVTDKLWEIGDIVKVFEEWEAKQWSFVSSSLYLYLLEPGNHHFLKQLRFTGLVLGSKVAHIGFHILKQNPPAQIGF